MTLFDANSAGTGSHCTSVCPPLPIICSSCSWSLITADDEGRQNKGFRKKQKLFFLIPWPTKTHNTVHWDEDSIMTLTQLLSTPALFLHSTRVRPSSSKICLEKIFGNNKILINISHRKPLPLINWLPLINNTPVEGIFFKKTRNEFTSCNCIMWYNTSCTVPMQSRLLATVLLYSVSAL